MMIIVMKSILVIILLSICVSGYDINDIKLALFVNFNVEEGVFSLFDIDASQYLPTCFGMINIIIISFYHFILFFIYYYNFYYFIILIDY